MRIFPAIDLKEGKAVRLLQGRMQDATVYGENPLEVALGFAEAGAEYLHIVDLNGAFAGKPVNDAAIRAIVQAVPMKVQTGGGIRSLERMEELLDLGVERVILGTVAVKNPELVEEAVRRFGERIVVGIDAKDGQVAVQGWAEQTKLSAEVLGRAMREMGVQHVVYTDISRDGMLQGVNLKSTIQLAKASGLEVIASGGVSSLADIQQLAEEVARGTSIEGAIIGKALYAGMISLKEALAVARGARVSTDSREPGFGQGRRD
ncbi:MAG: 1-(5-phosphoribosyl)-5-[(5-phosphoribosylamino)methylideneamino]imidazole-4-carboxamide isomerase [Desulfitobacteriaceae bacterium]|nr:1-(5-phosphoribosyl)-5-[(5-phosphoribosylamino)methylideneamino]imidazole-4-carboxamide isomerase [Desulfitobacteriaceae bacterium]MDI6880509.1 1-(5-phosphoribosyl)-5-[(5-phosphoribosylamino)methylideneamino]imidazole-4-carboxamide isomerase [Desulfitobacteriaceae bacterium]MDI6912697.1 1-(5-phosphoribosyl)-5-[(5-phosphoribosylamino)methylideneamino]imidazole-4-carboxamide isomerase [Desulfitobacteriaceae bacterium]